MKFRNRRQLCAVGQPTIASRLPLFGSCGIGVYTGTGMNSMADPVDQYLKWRDSGANS